ncbi:MAG: hypothetical protein WA842_10630 [Croceibacterium sp.]
MTMRFDRIAFAAALVASAAVASAQSAPTAVPAAQPPEARARTFAALPYWPGYWVSEQQAHTMIGGQSPALLEARAKGQPLAGFMVLNGGSAPWNAEGKNRFADVRARSAGRKAQGWGFPMMMNAATPLQFVITPEEVLIVNSYNETRHIYTDGRPMPPMEDMWPTVTGTSVGHWEGDTLVVETVMVTNPSEYFHGAPPLSEEARYVERFRLDGDRLVADVTITDPVTLTGPWAMTISWLRDEGYDRMIQINWDNDRTGVDDSGFNTIEAAPVEK